MEPVRAGSPGEKRSRGGGWVGTCTDYLDPVDVGTPPTLHLLSTYPVREGADPSKGRLDLSYVSESRGDSRRDIPHLILVSRGETGTREQGGPGKVRQQRPKVFLVPVNRHTSTRARSGTSSVGVCWCRCEGRVQGMGRSVSGWRPVECPASTTSSLGS